MKTRRVVVTGVGLKIPGGLTVETAWSSALKGVSQAKHDPSLEAAGVDVTFSCRAEDFDANSYFSSGRLRGIGRASQLLLAAAQDAIADIGGLRDPSKGGVWVGTSMGGIAELFPLITLSPGSMFRLGPYTIPKVMMNASAAQLGIALKVTGPCITVSTACASGATAICEGAQAIARGDVDWAIVGGVDSLIVPAIVHSFWRMGALSTWNDRPEEASRPFDSDRNGFVIGEGAGVLVLEDRGSAENRGAALYAEMAGGYSNTDAYHIAAPEPSARVAIECLRRALAQGGVAPKDIGHVNAHGTSTVLNDRTEALVIREVFGANVPVTALKGVTGHMMGASGAVEAIMAIIEAKEGMVPPIANFGISDESSQIDIVAGTPRIIEPGKPVASLSFGFGGHNTCLIFHPILSNTYV